MKFDLQGHRGARGLLPENTLPAFRHALDLGVTTLEMDVVISLDRQVVVSHDPVISHVICSWPDGSPVTAAQSQDLRLFEMTYERIRQFDCGLRGHPDFPEQQRIPVGKPLLKDVIAFAEEHVRNTGRAPVEYNIETKSRPPGDDVMHPRPPEFTNLLHEQLKAAGVINRATVQSFDLRTLREARRMDPGWRTSLLSDRLKGRFLRLNVARLGFRPTVYSPDYRVVTERMVTRAHRRGISVVPWTVNAPQEMLRLVGIGVDGLITDYPDRAVRVLERFLKSA